MKRATPAIPLFGDAYLADTRHLSLEEHGAYLQLLMIAWRSPQCALPDDDKRLSMMLGVTPKKWARLKPVVMAFWTLGDDGWQQARLLKERRFVAEKSEQNRAAINARWEAKRLKNNGSGDTDEIPDGYGNDTPPPPPIRKKKSIPPDGGYVFDGQVIRLTAKHFGAWAKSYPDIDLMAKLQSRDDWLANEAEDRDREKWFMSTSNYLAKLQQQASAAAKEPIWDGMP